MVLITEEEEKVETRYFAQKRIYLNSFVYLREGVDTHQLHQPSQQAPSSGSWFTPTWTALFYATQSVIPECPGKCHKYNIIG